jgi:hypothetical protein
MFLRGSDHIYVGIGGLQHVKAVASPAARNRRPLLQSSSARPGGVLGWVSLTLAASR